MGVFVVTAIGAAVVAALGLWAAQNAALKAKREREAEQHSERQIGRLRSTDQALQAPMEERNKASEVAIRNALAGTAGSNQQSHR